MPPAWLRERWTKLLNIRGIEFNSGFRSANSRTFNGNSRTWTPESRRDVSYSKKLLSLNKKAGNDMSKDPIKEASQAKYFATDNALKVASEAVQIMGAYGYSREYPVERLMRYIKVTQIFEGTNEIPRNLVARELLK